MCPKFNLKINVMVFIEYDIVQRKSNLILESVKGSNLHEKVQRIVFIKKNNKIKYVLLKHFIHWCNTGQNAYFKVINYYISPTLSRIKINKCQ